jgi:hypothetical protein
MTIQALSFQFNFSDLPGFSRTGNPEDRSFLKAPISIETIAKYFCDGYIFHYKGGTNLHEGANLLANLFTHLQATYHMALDSLTENYCRLATFLEKIHQIQTEHPTEKTYQSIQSVGAGHGRSGFKGEEGGNDHPSYGVFSSERGACDALGCHSES